MSWFQNKTGAKSESETLIGAAEQYSLLKAYGIEAVFPNVEVALRIYLSLMVSNCSGDRSFSRDSGVNFYTIICRHESHDFVYYCISVYCRLPNPYSD